MAECENQTRSCLLGRLADIVGRGFIRFEFISELFTRHYPGTHRAINWPLDHRVGLYRITAPREIYTPWPFPMVTMVSHTKTMAGPLTPSSK